MQIIAAEYAKILHTFGINSNNDLFFRFVLVRNNASFDIGGTISKCERGTMLCRTPDISVQIIPLEDYLFVDYVDFSLDEQELSRLTALPVSLNSPSAPPNFNELSSLLKSIHYLFYSCDKYRQEKLELHLWNLIFSIASGDENVQGLTGSNLLYHQMRQLRKQISDDPNTYTSVCEAANSVNLSVSRFQHLYKQLFSINYLQDLIHVRIKRARMLLQTTDWTVARIARELGYESETFFYRQFRQQVGVSPAEYRKMDILTF